MRSPSAQLGLALPTTKVRGGWRKGAGRKRAAGVERREVSPAFRHSDDEYVRSFSPPFLAAGVASCTSVVPLQLLPSTIPLEPGMCEAGSELVEGRACAVTFLYLLRWGDSSVYSAKIKALATAQSAGLVDVSVDIETSYNLFYTEQCTVVRGRALELERASPAKLVPPHRDYEAPARVTPVPIASGPDIDIESTAMNMTPEMITRGIESIRGRVANCSDEDPTASGRVMVSVHTYPPGAVSSVTIATSPSKLLSACVIRILQRAQFSPTRAGASFDDTFEFTP